MDFFQTYAKEIVALVVPFLTWLLNSSQRQKAKLIQGVRHSFTFLVDQPNIAQDGKLISPTSTAKTASFVIENVGKKAAHNVQVVFNWKPPCLNLWPNRNYDEKMLPDGRYVLTFDTLSPREFVGFEVLVVNIDLPDIVNVRCDEGVAQQVRMAPQQVVPQWKIKIAQSLLVIGFAASIYGAILLVQFLVLRTPVGLSG